MKKVAPPPPPPMPAPPPPVLNGKGVTGVRPTPGEDSAFDELLEGCMDLQVVLPDLKVVQMTVDRGTGKDIVKTLLSPRGGQPNGGCVRVIKKS
ncbi:hypothetical protein JTE90_014933 [Oedothorax gibbosus]|uniref:Uncharacterized protein n=1 Tax=Oedothorax gibbosus TaxID=931172 RepID=A0AAV6VL90_9ARAC|nr:hypothetical protein JTE90_014933 [Oedothorax gibbosus]